jgi:hypothetical protein
MFQFTIQTNVNLKINRTIILPFVLYGCETWSPTLREEHGLRVFENRVLKRIFGLKRDEVIVEWSGLHDKELYDLYIPPFIIWVIKSRILIWAGHVACVEGRRGAYRVLVGKSEGRRPHGRPRHRWEIILKWIFEKWDGGMDWIDLAWGRVR